MNFSIGATGCNGGAVEGNEREELRLLHIGKRCEMALRSDRLQQHQIHRLLLCDKPQKAVSWTRMTPIGEISVSMMGVVF